MNRNAWIRAFVLGLSAIVILLVVPDAGAQLLLEGKKFDTKAGLVGKAAHIKSDILKIEEQLRGVVLFR